jgi:DNA-binding transcriptional LysR family regulator
VLTSFHSAYPGIDLHLTEQGSRGLLDELAGGALDIALITTSEDGASPAASLQRTPLLTEELVVISSMQSPFLNGVASLTLEELASLPQITFHESYDLRATTMQAFHASGLIPQVVLEGAEMDAVLRCVERGLGVAVVPAMVMVDRPGLRSARLTTPSLVRSISLAHRNDVTLTRAAQAMQEMIIDMADIRSSANDAADGLITRAS